MRFAVQCPSCTVTITLDAASEADAEGPLVDEVSLHFTQAHPELVDTPISEVRRIVRNGMRVVDTSPL